MTFVGSDRAHNAVNDENIVRIHLVLGELTANGLTEQRRGNKGPALHRADAAGDNGLGFADAGHSAKTDNLITFPLNNSPKINK